MRVGFVEVGRQHHVLVRAHAVGLPHLFARGDIVGGHPPSNAELTAGDAHDELVLDHEAGHRHRLAPQRIGVLGFPQLLAALGVQRNHLSVERRHQDLALRVIHAAMDQITTCDRNGTVVLNRRISPFDGPALLGEVNGVHVVGVRAVHVHRRVHHQRLPFVAAQRARGERPDLSEIPDIIRGNLIERAVARRRVILPRQNPLIVVGLPRRQILILVLVGQNRQRHPQRQSHDGTNTSLHGLPLSLTVSPRFQPGFPFCQLNRHHYTAISEFPKWRKYLISLCFRGKSSVRPVQVGGFDVNIVTHRRGGPVRYHAWPPPWEPSCRTRTGPCGS